MIEVGVSTRAYAKRLNVILGGYVLVLGALVASLGTLEQLGVPNLYIGYLFFMLPLIGYTFAGILSRPTHLSDFYVAGRQVPAFYNGIATAASWVSAASIVGMAGTLHILGFDGLTFVLGWTAGFVLLAVLIAPYLRRSGAITVPEFLADRYQSPAIRLLAIVVVIVCLFAFLVAQFLGCALVLSRFLNLDLTVGAYVGFGIVLMCTVTGGMRSATWTQVAQYVVMLLAYLAPLIVLSAKKYGIPIPYFTYGLSLQDIAASEQGLIAKGLASAQSLRPHAVPFLTYSSTNFVALAVSLMLGTAVMPHILTRFATTATPAAARTSVAWTLFFITLIYLAAPAYAAFFKLEVVSQLVGQKLTDLPNWIFFLGGHSLVTICGKAATSLSAVEQACSGIAGHPGLVRLQDLHFNPDAVVLATPEIAGLPYIFAGLLGAGALAAAVSTASALLLTMSTALSHDLYFRLFHPTARPDRRLLVSRLAIVAVAAVSAVLAAGRPAELVSLVAWSFSLAASSLFAPLVLGIWWRRTDARAAIGGMVAGLGICLFYLLVTRYFPDFGVRSLGMTAFINPASQRPVVDVALALNSALPAHALSNRVGWLDIQPISAAVFGVPTALVTTWVLSLLAPRPSGYMAQAIEHLRNPVAPAPMPPDATVDSRIG